MGAECFIVHGQLKLDTRDRYSDIWLPVRDGRTLDEVEEWAFIKERQFKDKITNFSLSQLKLIDDHELYREPESDFEQVWTPVSDEAPEVASNEDLFKRLKPALEIIKAWRDLPKPLKVKISNIKYYTTKRILKERL